jgi:hypothetical protein
MTLFPKAKLPPIRIRNPHTSTKSITTTSGQTAKAPKKTGAKSKKAPVVKEFDDSETDKPDKSMPISVQYENYPPYPPSYPPQHHPYQCYPPPPQ